MTTNPRLLAVRRSLEKCTSHSQRRLEIQNWLEIPGAMHRAYKVPGTTISDNDLKKSKRVLRLWLTVYGSGTTPEFDARFKLANAMALSETIEEFPSDFTYAEKLASDLDLVEATREYEPYKVLR